MNSLEQDLDVPYSLVLTISSPSITFTQTLNLWITSSSLTNIPTLLEFNKSPISLFYSTSMTALIDSSITQLKQNTQFYLSYHLPLLI